MRRNIALNTTADVSGPIHKLGSSTPASPARPSVDLLRQIYLGISSAVGEEFFCYLAHHLAAAVGADYACICRCHPERGTLRTVAAVRDGKLIDNETFALTQTPFERLLSEGVFVRKSGVSYEFPGAFPAGPHVEGFAGLVLRDSVGADIGCMALLRSTPFADVDLARSLLEIFSVRAGAELERDDSVQALQDQLHFLQSLVDAIPHPVYYKDKGGRYLGSNDAFARLLGLERKELVGKTAFDIGWDQALAAQYQRADDELFSRGGTQTFENRLVDGEGRSREVLFNKATFTRPDGSVGGLVGTLIDITERKEAEREIHQLANYDRLTGLPNLVQFRQLLDQWILDARQADEGLAVLMLDLDNFKLFNDTLGFSASNQLLGRIADRLCQWARREDLVARVGGDKFVIALRGISTQGDVARCAERLQKGLERPFSVRDREVHCSGSIGIALYPDHGPDRDTLLRNADEAVYQAKQQQRGGYRFFTTCPKASASERLTLETGLRRAIERGELFLHYQPQFDLSTGGVAGVEALMRWRHPDRGLVPPGRFIPLAEKAGLIREIGAWALDQACRQNRAWQQAGLPPVRMAVNISGHQLYQGDFADLVEGTLGRTGLDPQWLELELTESAMMENTCENIALFDRLKRTGIHLSVDDFGTGYSSLAYLKRFPIDKLKIDRSFVHEIPGNADDVAIVEAIIAMAHGLGLKVLAEGVETAEQLHFLRTLRCDKTQGYLFGRPMAAEAIAELLGAGPQF